LACSPLLPGLPPSLPWCRRFQRGLKRKALALIKKLRKAKKEASPGEKPDPVSCCCSRVWCPTGVVATAAVYGAGAGAGAGAPLLLRMPAVSLLRGMQHQHAAEHGTATAALHSSMCSLIHRGRMRGKQHQWQKCSVRMGWRTNHMPLSKAAVAGNCVAEGAAGT
jgi:hypothetical protein